MTLIRLRNKSKAPVINSRKANVEGDKSYPKAKQNIVAPDTVGEFNGDNRSIQVYAKGGILVPSDAASKKWFEGLK